MKTRIARAGLIMGLALVCFGSADAEEAGFEWISERPHLHSMRAAIARGDVAAMQARFKRLREEGEWRGKLGIDLERAIDIQNLEFQLPPTGEKGIADFADLPDPDRLYLKARAQPSRTAFASVLVVDPKHGAARRALAVMDAEEGKLKEARAALEALLGENPADAETRCRLALVARKQGDVDLALEQWALALQADDFCAEAWYSCGTYWLRQGILQSAEKALAKAVDCDPIHWRAREGLIQAQVGMGKLEEAKAGRELLRARAAQLPRVGDRIVVADRLANGHEIVVWEALLDSVPWRFRIEWMNQAETAGKPIKIMELRRDGTGFAWGAVAGNGEFGPVKTLAALPELKDVLEEAR